VTGWRERTSGYDFVVIRSALGNLTTPADPRPAITTALQPTTACDAHHALTTRRAPRTATHHTHCSPRTAAQLHVPSGRALPPVSPGDGRQLAPDLLHRGAAGRTGRRGAHQADRLPREKLVEVELERGTLPTSEATECAQSVTSETVAVVISIRVTGGQYTALETAEFTQQCPKQSDLATVMDLEVPLSILHFTFLAAFFCAEMLAKRACATACGLRLVQFTAKCTNLGRSIMLTVGNVCTSLVSLVPRSCS
jgi:hypothetical protein